VEILLGKGVDVTANTANPDPACSFCDGTGVWTDPGEGPASTPDPCPLCDGAGAIQPAEASGGASADYVEASLGGVLAALPRLTQPERQQVYEELYFRWDCRVYQS
jgi:hypothetical protein